MPELPEVETVKNTLKRIILNKKIIDVDIRYNGIIASPSPEKFNEKIRNQKINDIKREGKWLIFDLDDYYLLSHLRMEGKYFLKKESDDINKHEHVIFKLDSGEELRYQDTRKFGKMYLINKDELHNSKPLKDLGLDPWNEKLTPSYLNDKFKNKKLPIKTLLLDQSIIAGIGNIYDDEILFLSHINPLEKGNKLDLDNLNDIIINTKKVLTKAIEAGGTTIRSYESAEGVHGRFQQQLLVHNHDKDKCPECGTIIIKIKVGGRGTYYCENCQKIKED